VRTKSESNKQEFIKMRILSSNKFIYSHIGENRNDRRYSRRFRNRRIKSYFVMPKAAIKVAGKVGAKAAAKKATAAATQQGMSAHAATLSGQIATTKVTAKVTAANAWVGNVAATRGFATACTVGNWALGGHLVMRGIRNGMDGIFATEDAEGATRLALRFGSMMMKVRENHGT
jgi:hypothetical protein